MSGATLDCVVCRTRHWRNLEADAAEEVRSTGATKLFCDNCARYTYWLFSENDSEAVPQRKEREPVSVGVGEAPPANGVTAVLRSEMMRLYQPERRKVAERRGGVRRTERRVALQLPVRLRVNTNGAQFEEVTRTVNVGRNGIYFQTERPYSKGLPTFVALHYSPREPGLLTEQKGTVVRVDSSPGSPARGVAIQLH